MTIVPTELRPPEAQHTRPIELVANVAQLVDIALDAVDRDREITKATLSQAIFILRSELQRNEAPPLSDAGAGRLAPWQVQRVRIYIDNNLGHSIQVRDLSEVARRSISHFCRAFKRTFGQTPHTYVTIRRLARAKKLMLESAEPLSAIALVCGFTDQAHLSNLFRQHFNEAPGAWRRRCTFDRSPLLLTADQAHADGAL